MDESVDFIIDQGANWHRVAFFQNPQSVNALKSLLSPISLKGCTAVMTAAAWPGAPTNIFELLSVDGSLVINAAAGSVAWDVPESLTAGFVSLGTSAYVLPDGTVVYLMGYYTLKVINAAGAVMRQISGKLYLNLDV
jgi:hypothetical protein